MENNDVIQEVKHDEHCFIGYLGAFLGGIVGVLPWMLLYLYSATNFLVLVALIPICALKGYQFFKGVVNQKTMSTIAIISVIVLLFSQIILFPELYGNRYDMNIKEFYESIHGAKYLEERSEQLGASIILVLLGFSFAALEISKILKNYNATNQMIRDTGTISLRKNSPIKGDGYVSPVKTAEEISKIDKWDDESQEFIVPKKKVNSKFEPGHITRTTITNDGKIYRKNYYNNKKNQNTFKSNTVVHSLILAVMILPFLIPAIIMIIIVAMFFFNNIVDSNISSNTLYNFSNQTLQMNISDDWEINDTEYTNSIIIEDSKTQGKSVVEIFEKDIYMHEFDSLKEFREYMYDFVTQEFTPITYRTLINRTLGTNSGCRFYYETKLSNGENGRVITYCIETENYFIAYITTTDINYDINDYTIYIEEYLNTIKDYGNN